MLTTDKPKEFVTVLKKLLDETKIFTREQWAEVLGVSVTTIERWITDQEVISASNLKSIIWIVQLDEKVSKSALEEFYKISSKPIGEVWRSGYRIRDSQVHRCCDTVDLYMVSPVFNAFMRCLNNLSPRQQEEALIQAVATCTKIKATQ